MAHESAGQPMVAEGGRELKVSAEYWRHIGALAFLHDTQKSLQAYTKSVDLDPSETDGWRFRGELHFRLGELTLAEADFDTVLKRGLQLGDRRTQSMACGRIGWVYELRGDLSTAEEFQSEALRLAEAVAWTEGMARAFVNLGNIHYVRGDLARAEEMQLKSLALNMELGSKEGMAASYVNVGIIYTKRGDLPRACDCWRKARDLCSEIGLSDKAAELDLWMRQSGCAGT